MGATVKGGDFGSGSTTFWASCSSCDWFSKGTGGSEFCRNEADAQRKADRHNAAKHKH